MKKIVTITIFLLLSFGGWAQEENKQNYQDKIEKLEKRISELDKEIQQIKNDYTIKEREIKNYVQENYEDWFTSHATILFWLVGILGILGAGIFIKRIVTREVRLKVKSHLDNDKWFNALNAKINKQLDQYKFKETIRFIVLSENQESENIMRTYFIENDFPEKNIVFRKSASIDINNDKVDIIFINNKDDSFKMKTNPFDPLITEIKIKNNNIAVFYFNDNGVNLPRHLNEGISSSFANSFASMYHNLLDLMRYKYLVLDRKNL